MEKITGIPEAELDQILEDLEFEGLHVVSRFRSPDGSWTIVYSTHPRESVDPHNETVVAASTYTTAFRDLVKTFLQHGSEYPQINAACIAQFILETGRGQSELAKVHKNYAGMKWRNELSSVAKKVRVHAPSETAYFCSFETLGKFVEGYRIFLDRSPYEGWEQHTADPEEFINFIAPIWATDPSYGEKLKDLLAEADTLIDQLGGTDDGDSTAPCCEGMSGEDQEWPKPSVEWDPSPFNFSRSGTEIDTIVMHYTTSRSLSGTVSWFKDPDNKRKTAAHYVIGRDGTIVQMVRDSDSCRHGNSQNSRSIGIEHSAAVGDKMTRKQEKSSVALIRWLMQEYEIERQRVIAHKCAPRNTTCPGDLFQDFGATGDSDCATTRAAVQAWLASKVLVDNSLNV